MVTPGRTKGRFLFECLGAGIDRPWSSKGILHPSRQQTPEHVRQPIAAVLCKESEYRLSGSDQGSGGVMLQPGFIVIPQPGFQNLLQVVFWRFKGETTAHRFAAVLNRS